VKRLSERNTLITIAALMITATACINVGKADDEGDNADFYVANRGNNTIVRMRQDGTVVAVRKVQLANGRSLGNGRLNGIAGSPDGSKIWVTVAGRLAGHENVSGAVLELPAF
jgi:hypothetical protein